MKLLTCNYCGDRWVIENTLLSRIKVCPYCGKAIKTNQIIEEIDSLDKAIYAAISHFGVDIVSSPSKMCGYMLDVAPFLQKEIRIFSRTFSTEYLSYLKAASTQDRLESEMTIAKLKAKLIDDDGLSESWAEMFCQSIQRAIELYRGNGEKVVLSVNVRDLSDRDNDLEVQVNRVCGDLSHTNSKDNTENEQGDSRKSFCCDIATKIEVLEQLGEVPIAKNTYERIISLLRQNELIEAVEELETVVARISSDSLRFIIAEIYEHLGAYDKAIQLYKPLKKNNAKAYFHAGICYQNIDDIDVACFNYREAAKMGCIDALWKLIQIARDGTAVLEPNEKQMVQYLQQGAEAGDPEMQFRIGVCYKEGYCVNKSDKTALSWLSKAAQQDHKKAKDMLDQMTISTEQSRIEVQKLISGFDF